MDRLRRSTHFFALTWAIVPWATRYGTLRKGFWLSFVDTHTVRPVRRRCMAPSVSISALTTAIRGQYFTRLKQGPWSECQTCDFRCNVAGCDRLLCIGISHFAVWSFVWNSLDARLL